MVSGSVVVDGVVVVCKIWMHKESKRSRCQPIAKKKTPCVRAAQRMEGGLAEVHFNAMHRADGAEPRT